MVKFLNTRIFIILIIVLGAFCSGFFVAKFKKDLKPQSDIKSVVVLPLKFGHLKNCCAMISHSALFLIFAA